MIFNHKTMTEEAALALRKGILQGSYPSGTRLVPAKLEEELQLSRTAIREAIRELVGTGLADSETHKGACVAEPLELEEIPQFNEQDITGTIILRDRDEPFSLSVGIIGMVSGHRDLINIQTVEDLLGEIDRRNDM